MMKIRIVEIHPPPSFQAATPASIPLNGPSMFVPSSFYFQTWYLLSADYGNLDANDLSFGTASKNSSENALPCVVRHRGSEEIPLQSTGSC